MQVLLKKNCNYYYDNRQNDNSIEELIGDLKNELNKNHPTILINRKEYNIIIILNFGIKFIIIRLFIINY